MIHHQALVYCLDLSDWLKLSFVGTVLRTYQIFDWVSCA
jgi:hypothetical protein